MVLNTKSPLIVCGTALTDELFHLTTRFTLHNITVYLHYTVLQCIGNRRFTVFRRTPLYCHYYSRNA